MNRPYNIVRDWNARKILYTTLEGLSDACEWMMSRIETLDIDNTSADEILENEELSGSWFISDLLENNPQGWELNDGTIVAGHIDDETGKWIIERRSKA